MKIAVIGCGLRTPLLIHGLARSGLDIARIVLYDIEPKRAQLMACLGGAIAEGTRLQISAGNDLAAAVQDCTFVISSVRVGGMEARARDERLSLDCGFAGQETTGPAGFAMALRTVPVAIEHARLVQQVAPEAWIVNFTNPAGLITQAISVHTGARVVGICDTPAELFFRIALALREPPHEVECEYFGLNHLGWVRAVRVRGRDVTAPLLEDDSLLRSLYPAELFSPQLIRCLRLIPTEYLFFYYSQRAARKHQLAAGATRAEELLQLNRYVTAALESSVQRGDAPAALRAYRAYLNRRNASYMHLEGCGESAFAQPDFDWDPFEGATGYHRIAVEAISALSAAEPRRMVLNVPNHGAIEQLAREDVIESPCLVDKSGPRPIAVGSLPEAVRGLTVSVKTYERLAIEAAVRMDRALATQALFTNPIVGDWEGARNFMQRLSE
jgi:6-phospho-beta-glucosidase